MYSLPPRVDGVLFFAFAIEWFDSITTSYTHSKFLFVFFTFYLCITYVLHILNKEREKKTFSAYTFNWKTKWKEFEIETNNKSYEGLRDDKFIFIELTQFQDVKWKWLVTKIKTILISYPYKNKYTLPQYFLELNGT